MKQKLSPPFGCRLSLITILLAIAFSGRATTITWTNTAGGDWSDAANWSPNQVPGAADTAQITTSGNYTVTNDQSTAVFALTVGGGATGVQNLQVAGGAALTFTGNSTVNANGSLSVASGGWLQAAAYLYLSGPLTNAGAINVTNGYAVYIYNTGNGLYAGGVVNQSSGVIDLWNNSSLYGQGYGDEYLINQGTINLMTGAATSYINFYNLNTGAGTITTQPGTGKLQVGPFNGPGTLAGTYNAAVNSIIQFTASASAGTSPGTPLVTGGTGQYQFSQGLLTLPTAVIPNLVMNGGTLLLGPGFEGGTITNLVLDGSTLTNTLPVSGRLVMTNGTLYTSSTITNGTVISLNGVTVYGSLVISSGAVLSAYNYSVLDAQVTVQSGGQLLVNGNTYLGDGSATNTWLTVSNGGLFQAAGNLNLYDALTNSGTFNVTNGYVVNIYDNGSAAYAGGIVNQSSGVIDLWNNSSLSGQHFGNEYLINQGTINLMTGAGTSYINFYNVNMGAGTITTQPGTGALQVGAFNGLGTLAGTYNAAANSVIAFFASTSPGTSAGTPLVLGGTGQYQFIQGLLTLPTAVIPDLVMNGGTLLLGADFEGGAITNLVLSGVTLTNTLPISGTLVMTNCTLYTSSTITNGTVINLNGVTVYGSLVISSGAVLSVYNSVLDAQVTVFSGGQLLGAGNMYVGDGSMTNSWLTVSKGGWLQAAGYLDLYGPLTNAGTINLTNGCVVNIYNNGSAADAGGIVNQSSGVIDLWNNGALSGQHYGDEYLINLGAINLMTGAGTGYISFYSLDTGAGTITTQPGTGTLRLGTFNELGTLAGTYNAATNSIIQFTASTSPGTSAGTPLVLGGEGQYQFIQGLLTLPTAVIPNLVMSGGTLLLGPGFEGGAITNLVLDGITLTNTLPISGTLVMTNCTLCTSSTITNGAVISLNGVTVYGSLVISSGAVLSGYDSVLDAQVTVQGGGQLLVNGSAHLGDGSVTNSWLTVSNGGVVEAGGNLYLYEPLTNAGTVNLTNGCGLYAYNDGSAGYAGGIVNQSSGVIDLWNNSSLYGTSDGDEYLINQGTINLMTGAGTSSINFYNLNMGAGTITTQPGTGALHVGAFNGLGTLAGTYNAAANSVIAFLAGTSPGTCAGTPLVMGGTGQFQFIQGLLTLPTAVIPNLVMSGGTLLLGPGFEGGAIMNLELDGMTLTNTLPISGTLVMTNGTLYTSSTISNGTLISLNGVTVYGSLVISSGAVLSAYNNPVLNAQVTVQSGGQLLVNGGAYLGDGSVPNTWLTVLNGGAVQAAGYLYLRGPLTNAGTINVTNGYVVYAYNNGSAADAGGIVNQSGGLIDLWNNSSLSGQYYGNEYLINQGTINLAGGSGMSVINFYNLTNQAVLSAQHGTLQLQSANMNLQSSGTLDVGLNSSTDYGEFSVTGNAPLNGTFEVQLNNGYVPQPDSSFSVLSYSSFSGGFTGFSLPTLPPKAVWQPLYSSTALTLLLQPPINLLSPGTNVVININGTPGHQTILLTSTNLTVPLINWTPVATNTFDVTTYLGVTNTIDPNTPRQFFIFKLP